MNDYELLHPQESCINEIFENSKYIIPIYQRNYAWENEEIETLLEDIIGIPDKLEKYYLGNLIVNSKTDNTYEVIDGQQRLTTLYLLLIYLESDTILKDSLRFEAREKSNKILNDIYNIRDISKIQQNSLKNNQYSIEILKGYSFIVQYFEGKKDTQIKQRFVNDQNIKTSKNIFKEKLKKVFIIRTQVPKNIDFNHYFEIMNTRGEQLELHEIVKSRIIDAIEDPKDKIIAAMIWDASAQMNKYVQMNFNLTCGHRGKLFGIRNWDTFTCKSFSDIKALIGDDIKYEESSYTLRHILENKMTNYSNIKKDNEENERFKSIISFPNFLLQVNALMNIKEKNKLKNINLQEYFETINNDEDINLLDDKYFIRLLEKRWSDNYHALDFIYSLLKYRYLYDKFIIKREYSEKYKENGKWSLKRLVSYYDKNERPSYRSTFSLNINNDDEEENDQNEKMKYLQACLRITYTSPKTMDWIYKVLMLVDKEENYNDIIDFLERYCCKKVQEADYKNKTGFNINHIVFTYVDYILYKYVKSNKDFNNLKLNEIDLKNFDFQFRNSIEHFFPQNPDGNKQNCNDVNKTNRDSLGNLALVTVSGNSLLSNYLPYEKIKKQPEIINQSPKLMLMSKMLEENNNLWNDNLVLKHYKDVIDILEAEIKEHLNN